MHGADSSRLADLGPTLAVYTNSDRLASALLSAERNGIPLIMRDDISAQSAGGHVKRHPAIPIIVDLARWRGGTASAHRLFDVPAGFRNVRKWCESYLRASDVTAVFTPSLFLTGGDWSTLCALSTAMVDQLPPGGPVIGLIATEANMLDPARIDHFLSALEPLATHRLAFLFAGANREFLGDTGRLIGLRRLLKQQPTAWLLGVDALVASDALCGGAALAAVGIRPVVRWPSPPGNGSNGKGAKDFIPGLLDRDLLEYRSPSVYADWYSDSVSAACGVCGRHPENYNSSPADKDAIDEHNVHAAARLCADLLTVPSAERDRWLMLERIEAASLHQELNSGGTAVTIDRTLMALIQRDSPGWSLALQH
jgi:hypothetical protein